MKILTKTLLSMAFIGLFSTSANAEFIYIGDGDKIDSARSIEHVKHVNHQVSDKFLSKDHGLDSLGSNGLIKGFAGDAPMDVIISQLVPDDWTVRCDTCDDTYSWSSKGEKWKDIFTRTFPNHIVEYNDKTKTVAMFPSVDGEKSWSVRKSEDANQSIERWRIRAGWNASVWSATNTYPMMVDYSFKGSFRSAVVGLIGSLNASNSLGLRPVFYSNKVVKIEEVR